MIEREKIELMKLISIEQLRALYDEEPDMLDEARRQYRVDTEKILPAYSAVISRLPISDQKTISAYMKPMRQMIVYCANMVMRQSAILETLFSDLGYPEADQA